MTEYTQMTIGDAAGWSEANDLVCDFADGVIRELGFVAGEHVDATGVMHYDGFPRLIVHAQMQGAGGTSARLEFVGVRRLAFDYDVEVSPAEAKDIAPNLWEVCLLGLRVVAQECAICVARRGGLGEGPFIVQT